MNIYEFDGTIYDGDSTVDFYKFIMKRHPLSLRHIPSFVLATLKHKRGKYTTTRWKSCFFMFLKDIDDVTGEVKTFWEKNMKKIYPWYLKQKRSDDVIISASPEFLLKLPCQQLQTDRLIASRVDPHTGEFQGLNCKGSEKVKRFRELFPTDRQLLLRFCFRPADGKARPTSISYKKR